MDHGRVVKGVELWILKDLEFDLPVRLSVVKIANSTGSFVGVSQGSQDPH